MARALAEFSEQLHGLSDDSRVTVRRAGVPDPNGRCVVYWMQRAQRGIDNHAVDLAVRVGSRGVASYTTLGDCDLLQRMLD